MLLGLKTGTTGSWLRVEGTKRRDGLTVLSVHGEGLLCSMNKGREQGQEAGDTVLSVHGEEGLTRTRLGDTDTGLAHSAHRLTVTFPFCKYLDFSVLVPAFSSLPSFSTMGTVEC